MERGNTKHGRHVDDQLAEEVEAEVRAGEDQPEEGLVPEGERPGGAPAPMTADEVEQRSRLGTYVPRSVLPADRDALLRAATGTEAPDDVLFELSRLPAGRKFGTISEVWAALGHPNEERFP